MPLKLDQVRKMLDAMQLRYFLDPSREALLLGIVGVSARFQFMVNLYDEGRFLQLRTVGYAQCSADHKHVGQVLALLGQLNYTHRVAKFGWDPQDGEIAVYADVWIMDGTFTQQQFEQTARIYLTVVDLYQRRVAQTIETGKDPGEIDPKKPDPIKEI